MDTGAVCLCTPHLRACHHRTKSGQSVIQPKVPTIPSHVSSNFQMPLPILKGCTEIPLLRDDELILCSNILPAYCFTSKRWALLLDIDSVLPISWNDDAFSKLVLPASHKDLVLSFMEAHISGDVHFDDIIKGKGLGLLMLLVGDPGLGKTLTAEAVAEKVHRPLYILSAGELGRDAGSVEKALQDVLNMTAKWNAVLLLDECDVFLEERNSARLDHNAIVAVFLRSVHWFIYGYGTRI